MVAEKVFLDGPMAGIGAEEADVDGATVGDLPFGGKSVERWGTISRVLIL